MLWTTLIALLLLGTVNYSSADITDVDYVLFRISKPSKDEYNKYLGAGLCSEKDFDEQNETARTYYKDWEMKNFLNNLRTVLTNDLTDSEIDALKNRPKIEPIINARPPPIPRRKCNKLRRVIPSAEPEEVTFADTVYRAAFPQPNATATEPPTPKPT